MSKIVYHGKEYISDNETVVNIDLNDTGYTKDEVDAKIDALNITIDNKAVLDKISEDTEVTPLFNGKALAYQEEIETSVNNLMGSYLTTDDAVNTYATKALVNATIQDVGGLRDRLDNINDNIAPTNYYTKNETRELIANAEVGGLVQFESLTLEQKEELKGEKGDTGNQGLAGDSAYDSAVKLGYLGTEEDWVASLKGKSAYELAVEEGYAYTQDVWLQSLIGAKGDKGDNGDNGDSAFQIAVENGLTTASTAAEWVASLKGEKGDTGAGITSIEQTTVSTENEGINVITCTLENGTTSEFQVRNGEQGLDGFALIPTTQIDDQIGRIWLAN